jgi:hypothetical protein
MKMFYQATRHPGAPRFTSNMLTERIGTEKESSRADQRPRSFVGRFRPTSLDSRPEAHAG